MLPIMDALLPIGEPAPEAREQALLHQAEHYIRSARAGNTLRAYRSDWRHFDSWCRRHGRTSCPATEETLALYLTEEAGCRKVSTLQRRLSSISEAHRTAGFETPARAPAVKLILAGIRREKGSAPRGKRPILVADLDAMLKTLPDGLTGSRDRALLLIGFAGAFRRSELVAIEWGDVEFREGGVVITVRRSKTDPAGQGRAVGIPPSSQVHRCPVRALLAWRELSGQSAGPVFRPIAAGRRLSVGHLSDKAVARIVKRTLSACGREAAEYAGHSLRAGFATAAAMGGAPERLIMTQTGHRSSATVRRYIRDGTMFRDNAADYTGL
jgi:integrase